MREQLIESPRNGGRAPSLSGTATAGAPGVLSPARVTAATPRNNRSTPGVRSPATFRAVILDRLGGPEVLHVVEHPTPVPGAGEALVRVRAAGVAYAQVMMRHGTYPYAPRLPFTPGAEVVGEVVALGAGVAGWEVGSRVAAFTGVGGYAELAVVPAASLVAVPEDLDPSLVAALPMNYVTAHQILHRVADVREGETVLVHGASGGVGSALVQLATLAGLRVLGTASPRNLAFVAGQGAVPLDYTHGNPAELARAAAGRPVDVVLDPIGGDHVIESARAIRPGGRLVVYGFSGPNAASPESVATLRRRVAAWNADPNGPRASIYSLGEVHRDHPEHVREDLARMVALLSAGRIAPVVAARISLADVRRAHTLLEFSSVQGKLVLMPQGDA